MDAPTEPAQREQIPPQTTTRSAGSVWPPVVLLGVMALARAIPALLEDGPPWVWMVAAFGPLLGGASILFWWLLMSGGAWRDRFLGLGGMVAAFFATLGLLHPTMLGPGVIVMTFPLGAAGFAIGAVLLRGWSSRRRAVAAVLLATLAMASTTLVRSQGMWGGFSLDLAWRWTPTSEDAVLSGGEARRGEEVAPAALEESLAEPEWPGFRGPDRDSRQHGPAISADWKANPPEELWRIAVGPGWSSFAVAGELLFTLEQRGESETVVCYHADTGLEAWTHDFEARFDDPLGGPGPRATPTLADGGLFVLGATGLLARLDPADGGVVWQRDLREEAGRDPPVWGFASSPLVIDSKVVVYAGGEEGRGVLAFDVATGEPAWSAPAGAQSYCSPQPAELLGERFVLSLSDTGLDLLDPSTGEARLSYPWPIQAQRSVQPQVIGDADVLIPSDLGEGTRRIRVSRGPDGLAAEDVWSSRRMKPDFNDLVIHDGHAYGFNSQIFSSINLENGELNWKGGRYGKGQVLLLENQGMLLVISEQGELVLLKADPTRLIELARMQALDGKTWNHPVLVGDRLYLRNSQEAAAYRMPLADE